MKMHGKYFHLFPKVTGGEVLRCRVSYRYLRGLSHNLYIFFIGVHFTSRHNFMHFTAAPTQCRPSPGNPVSESSCIRTAILRHDDASSLVPDKQQSKTRSQISMLCTSFISCCKNASPSLMSAMGKAGEYVIGIIPLMKRRLFPVCLKSDLIYSNFDTHSTELAP